MPGNDDIEGSHVPLSRQLSRCRDSCTSIVPSIYLELPFHNMETLELTCWIRGDDPGNVFRVEISRTENVAALRDAIKSAAFSFPDVPAYTLSLYKPNVPICRPCQFADAKRRCELHMRCTER